MFLAKKSHKITKNIRKRKKNAVVVEVATKTRWEVIAQLKNYAYE